MQLAVLSAPAREYDGIQQRRIKETENVPISWRYLTFETEIARLELATTKGLVIDPRTQSLPPWPDITIYDSPILWSDRQKWIITWTSCIATVLAGFAAGSYSSAFQQIAAEWSVSDITLSAGLTVFTFGVGIAPMVLAPFSEINGRKPVFVVTGILFVLFHLCCALTRTYWGMIVSRFLEGCASSVFSTVVAGVASDIYLANDRNTAMAMLSGSALFGSGLGPLASGFIVRRTTWRWIFYAQTISCGVLLVLMVIVFRETRGSVLLLRKAKVLNRWYEDLEQRGYNTIAVHGNDGDSPQTSIRRIRWKVRHDRERNSIMQMIKISVCRPIHLLFTEPIVFFFSLWVSFSWAVLYTTFAAIPLVFRDSYGFDVEQCGAVFGSMCVASILSTVLSILQDRWIRQYLAHTSSPWKPERHLYVSCIQSLLLPIGCFWFGWTSSPSNAWILPVLGIGCATMGIFSIYLAVFNYLAEIYEAYASSALAAQGFCRNLLGGIFPLVIPAMLRNLTFHGAGNLLGSLGVLLTLVPWVLVAFGPSIRARSRFIRAKGHDSVDSLQDTDLG